MKKILIIIFAILLCAVVSLSIWAIKKYDGNESVRIYIPHNATVEGIKDTLNVRLGQYGGRIYHLLKVLSANPQDIAGSYVIAPGDRAYAVANRIAKGRQTPVKVTVNVARTLGDIANNVAARLEASPEEIALAIDSVLAGNQEFMRKATFPAAVVPDTYEFYWNASPRHVVETLVEWRNRFWDDERRAKASRLGLTPVEVVTLASIVEEESNKSDEQPVIARLYLNRLKKGMRLQADPTVKFAVGDFTLRRITGRHLAVESPYNTYKVNGLPPGPIRLPQKSTVDAVLNAPLHNYLYMCAKEDFSGYHNFAADYATHMQNARRYTDMLNKRGIR